MHTFTFTSTWQGRRGTATTYQSVARRSYLGIRVIAQVWDDEPGTAELRLIRGDGRTPNFRLIRTDSVATENAAATAEAWLIEAGVGSATEALPEQVDRIAVVAAEYREAGMTEAADRNEAEIARRLR